MEIEIENVVENIVSVKLVVSGWTATGKASDVAREVEVTKGATSGACGVDVYYLDYEVAHKLGTLKSRLKTEFNLRTLPFEDGGWRIVMADQFMNLMEAIAPLKDEYTQFVQYNIIAERNELEKIARTRLGKLFDRFPEVEELESKFGVEFLSRAVRVEDAKQYKGMSDATIAMIRESERKMLMGSVMKACVNITDRLKDIACDLHCRLGKDVQDKTRYGSLFAAIKTTCSALKELNFTGDERLDKLIADTESLSSYSPESVRAGGWAKRAIESKVKLIVDELSSFGVTIK